jgi:hypothetical protein
MRHLNYIPEDGYTEPGYVKALPQVYDSPLRFRFRPPLPEERAEHFDAVEKLGSLQASQLAENTFIAERIAQWDHADTEGKIQEITAVTVGRMKTPLVSKVYGIITGLQPSDIDPLWDEKTKLETVAHSYESAKFAKPVGDVRQGESEKN